MGNLSTLLPELEQGKALYNPVWHIYLTPIGEGKAERTQYLMEGEWAEPRIIDISELKEKALHAKQWWKDRHTQYANAKRKREELDIVLLFGKYKGKHFSETPSDYLEWLCAQKGGISKSIQSYFDVLHELESFEYDEPDQDLDYDWEIDEDIMG